MEAGGEVFWELFDVFNFWALIVLIIVVVWMFYNSLVFRSKDGSDNNIDNFTPGVFPAENDNLKMELTWTIVPFILIVYLTFIAWGPIDEMWTADPDAHEVKVNSSQWSWAFDCGDLDADICEVSNIDVEGQTRPLLRLKAGESYMFNMTSTDVTHAPFFLDWGIKEDTQPGMYTRLYHTPSVDEIGSSLLMCTEYCGKDHGYMTAVVEVHA